MSGLASLASLSFASPMVLVSLALLPAIWWLLRFTPPAPRRFAFPPTRLLLDLKKSEETPDKSPWWLTLLRMLLAALVILALSGPIWNPVAATLTGSGPLLVVVDTAWPSGKDFEGRRSVAERVLVEAEAADRPVILAATAPREAEQDLLPKSAVEARRRLAAFLPQPHGVDRMTLIPALEAVIRERGVTSAAWIADGLETGSGFAFAQALSQRLPANGLAVYAEPAGLALGLKAPSNGSDSLVATVIAATRQGARGVVQGRDGRGRIVAEEAFVIEPGQSEAQVTFRIPIEVRNDVTTLEILAEDTAGAVQLLDDRARRRTVGLVSSEAAEAAQQPLLSPLHYISRALSPFADLREPERGAAGRAVRDLVRARTSVIVLADVGTVSGEAAESLDRWIEAGGTLIRFSGPRLAAGADELTPVRLRRGGRTLGGSLSWETPQPLAPFTEGPFAGIPSADDVKVERQLLAEPDPALAERTWATLADGTPLVTAVSRGRGRIVLFHVTADTRWSNLPLSGTFVEMLRRILAMSAGVVATEEADQASEPVPAETTQSTVTSLVRGEQLLAPLRALDGRGALGAPPGTAKPVGAGAIDGVQASRDHPPGLYGAEDAYRALNLLKPADSLAALDLPSLGGLSQVRSFRVESAVELKPWLLSGAAGLLLIDAIAVIALAAGFGLIRFGRAAGAVALAAVLLGAAPDARAQASKDDFAKAATLATRLAYVVTGDSEIDSTSLAGLKGLTRYLTERTALEPGEPIGVDPGRDELSFFPLLYWPVDSDAVTPPPATLAKVDAFMKQGGTILFDTRDELFAPSQGSGGLGRAALQRLMSGLDLPALEPAPSDHVVTKAFYLLQEFPGRYQGGPLWVEAMPEADPDDDRPARPGDGVSSIIITSNDFAGAWAINERSEPIYPTTPSEPRQRELAYRSGVNIMMYVLTGNYKADQVHIPALLERLGQ